MESGGTSTNHVGLKENVSNVNDEEPLGDEANAESWQDYGYAYDQDNPFEDLRGAAEELQV
jgi:hypothetical protein